MEITEIKPVHRLGAQLNLQGALLIELGAHIECCERFSKPHLVQQHIDALRTSLDTLEHAISVYEAERIANATAVEHQQDISNGAVSFKAFRDARGGL